MAWLSPTEIGILESGFFTVSWQVYKTGYDVAFALFYEGAMVPGSNYGAMAHDEMFHGQAIASLAGGGILSLRRIDTLGPQSILNQIGGGTLVTGASILLMKIG